MASQFGASRRGGEPRLSCLAVLFFLVFLIGFSSAQGTPQDPDYTCAPDRPCAIGCCGKSGICGMGPDFCAPENCVNSCDAKSECDPAGWGPTYALSEGCPLNVCCSKFGFCGTTTEFCGDTQIQNPTCSGTSASKRNIGYYEGWSITRACDVMYPENIPVASYTHINFAFASIDPSSFEVVAADPGDVALYSRVTGLKALFPNLQVWISIGGWTMNDPDQPTATTFSDLAGSESAQQRFFASLISFMSTYGFDGVDIDWEYPVAPERSGKPEDYENYPTFLSNMRNAFQASGHNYGITITMPSSFWYLQHFDIVKLEPLVDWFNMMEYDLHGTWDSTDVWIGAYVFAHTNLTEIDQSLKLLWRNNIDPSKVVMGIGFYGRSFELEDPSCSSPGCPFTGGAPAGQCTASVGTLSFAEIERLVAAGATVTHDEAAAVKIVTWGGGNWVSYDDAETLQAKLNYANQNCLGGTMVWAASTDDTAGTAAKALTGIAGGATPGNILLANGNLGNQCQWTSCIIPAQTTQVCPNGFTASASVFDGCPFSIPTGGSIPLDQVPRRYFCCPSDEAPTCGVSFNLDTWACTPKSCPSGYTQIATTQAILGPTIECKAGQINVCCTSNTAVSAATAGCTWTGGAPNCAPFASEAVCPAGTAQLVGTSRGDGGAQPCTSGFQSLCCPSPLVFDTTSCDWYRNTSPGGFAICRVGCPPGKMQLAIDGPAAGCIVGQASYCCDPPITAAGGVSQDSLTAFQNAVNTWLANGAVCQSTTAGAAFKKRSMMDMADLEQELQDLEKRQNSGNGVSLLTSLYIAHLFVPLLIQWNLGYQDAQIYGNAWDTAVRNHPSVDVTFADLTPAMHPPYFGYDDPDDLLNTVLCGGTQARERLGAITNTATRVCQLPTSVNPRGCPGLANLKRRSTASARDVFPGYGNSSFTGKFLPIPRKLANVNDTLAFSQAWARLLEDRTISPDQGITRITNGEQPSLGALMIAVMSDRMTFQYTDLVQISDSAAQEDDFLGPANRQQGILEVAWLMGPNNDYHQIDPQLQQFQGTDLTQRPAPDSFFVMHFHIDHIMHDQGGNSFPGIYAYNAWHGQFVNNNNRVDGNSVRVGSQQRNLRTPVVECPGYDGPNGPDAGNDNRYVYPGLNVDNTDTFDLFLQYLANEGILTRTTFEPIINVATDTCEFFDWEQLPSGSTGSLNPEGRAYQRPPGF